jgi:serine/threonine protein kinase
MVVMPSIEWLERAAGGSAVRCEKEHAPPRDERPPAIFGEPRVAQNGPSSPARPSDPTVAVTRVFARGERAGDARERAGSRLGDYELLQQLGEGGFGTVWLAERREPMVQRVALKLMKPGMDSGAVVARFEQERQALAVMDHPNVAKVYDAGVTSPELGSRPYFVMELVQGEPITDF